MTTTPPPALVATQADHDILLQLDRLDITHDDIPVEPPHPLPPAKRLVYASLPTLEQVHETQRLTTEATRQAQKRAQKRTRQQPRPGGPFRFFDLPSELRIRILSLILVRPTTIDVFSDNARKLAPRLALLRVSRRMHAEAHEVFYARNTFRIFVTEWTSFETKKMLLTRLAKRHRNALTRLELRLGPGWGKPPKTWLVGPKLGLADCTAVRSLKVFVEVDPSHPMFEGFRVDPRFYTDFSCRLLAGVLAQVPTIREVEFDARRSVRKQDSLMQGLLNEVALASKRIVWGPERDWDAPEEPAVDMVKLQNHLISVHG